MTRIVKTAFLSILLAIGLIGVPASTIGADRSNSARSCDLLFPATEVGVVFGEQYDPDLGLYYLRARFHRPRTGRFWTADSWEGENDDAITLNRYVYGNSDPIRYLDPTGYFGGPGSMGAASIGNSIQSLHSEGVTAIGNTLSDTAYGYQTGLSGDQIFGNTRSIGKTGNVCNPPLFKTPLRKIT